MNRDEMLMKAVGQAVKERMGQYEGDTHSAFFPDPPALPEVRVVVNTKPIADVLTGLREDMTTLAAAVQRQGDLIERLVGVLSDRPAMEFKPEFNPSFSPSFSPVTNVSAPGVKVAAPAVSVAGPVVNLPERKPPTFRIETDRDGNKRIIPE